MLKKELKNGNWKESLKEMFSSEPLMFKKAMSFASFKIKEFEQFGDQALEESSPFDEMDILRQNIEILVKDSFDQNDLEIID
jgi:hypothetical protein